MQNTKEGLCCGSIFMQPGIAFCGSRLSPVRDRILRMSYPTIDHRGPECGPVGPKVQDGIKTIFKTTQPVRFPKGAARAVVVLASSAFGTHIAEWSGINLRILVQQKGMILIMRVRIPLDIAISFALSLAGRMRSPGPGCFRTIWPMSTRTGQKTCPFWASVNLLIRPDNCLRGENRQESRENRQNGDSRVNRQRPRSEV
jgi:hypothetical protein